MPPGPGEISNGRGNRENQASRSRCGGARGFTGFIAQQPVCACNPEFGNLRKRPGMFKTEDQKNRAAFARRRAASVVPRTFEGQGSICCSGIWPRTTPGRSAGHRDWIEAPHHLAEKGRGRVDRTPADCTAERRAGLAGYAKAFAQIREVSPLG